MARRPSTILKVGTETCTVDSFAARTGAAKRPVVVMLHGVDGMVGESASEIYKLAEQIADDGYLVFVPHYLGSGSGTTELPSPDVLAQRTAHVNRYRPCVAAAVDYAVAQPDGDSSRLGLVGLSLGGGLALWYAESAASGKVKALVDFFGHVSDPAIYSNAAKLPPTLVFHNKGDGIVPVRHSIDVIAALARDGVTHDSQIYDEVYAARFHHTFRPGGPADVDSRARTRKWLDTHVKP
jgi:dienelactone hydrolase